MQSTERNDNMKKRNMLFAGLVTAVLAISSASFNAMAEENVVFTYDFDNLADTTLSSTEGSIDTLNALDPKVLTFERTGSTADIIVGEKSGTKIDGSSLTTDGENDKDAYLTFDVNSGSSTYLTVSVPDVNAEEKDIKISFNLLVQSGTNGTRESCISVYLIGETQYKILSFTPASKGTKIAKTVAAGNTNTTNVHGMYCYYEMIFHTASNTVDIVRKYLSSATLVEEVLAENIDISASFDIKTLKSIKFSAYYNKANSNKTAKDKARVDDITVSEIEQASAITEFAVSAPEICVNDASVAEITAGTAAVGKVHVQVPANLEEAKNVTLIGALYDGNNTLVQAYIDGTKTYAAGGEMVEEDVTLSMPLTGALAGYKVKLFVWDTAVNMNALSDTIATAAIVE